MNGRLFTESELEIVNDTNLTHTEVSKIIGRSVSTISLKRKSLGVKAKSHFDKNRQYINLLMDETKTNSEIANILNLKPKVVVSRRWHLGVKGIY